MSQHQAETRAALNAIPGFFRMPPGIYNQSATPPHDLGAQQCFDESYWPTGGVNTQPWSTLPFPMTPPYFGPTTPPFLTNPGIEWPNVLEINKNTDTYVGYQGVYKIEVNGKLWKYGKADMTNVSNRTREVVRLRTSINEAKEANPGAKVTGRIIYQNKNISTLDIKAIETAYIQEYYDTHGTLPPGNPNHPGIEY